MLPHRLWRALSLQDLHLSRKSDRVPHAILSSSGGSAKWNGEQVASTAGPNWRAIVFATKRRNEVPVAIPLTPPSFFCTAVIDANMNDFATSCGVSALAKSSAAETNNSSVSVSSRHTRSISFVHPLGPGELPDGAVRRHFAKVPPSNCNGDFGNRSLPVGLGSAELDSASLATQLESRRSSVPEKLRSTRVSLSTLGHASPDSWQLPRHSCSFLGSRGCVESVASAHIVCTLGKFIPDNLATVFGPMEKQKRNTAEQLPRTDLRVAIPWSWHGVSLETTPEQNLLLPRRNPGQDFIIGTLWRNTSSRLTWS